MRRPVAVALVVLALALAFVAGPSILASPSTSDVVPETETAPELYTPPESESALWPYLNSRTSFEQRSAINLVVRADLETVTRVLTEETAVDWNETVEEREEADPETFLEADNESVFSLQRDNESDDDASGAESTDVDDGGGDEADGIAPAVGDASNGTPGVERNETGGFSFGEGNTTSFGWSQAVGSTRYAYLDPGDGSGGQWMTESLQVDVGDYYGARYHIRLYESPNPDDEWVAMQAHHEHFDWFTLRHRVDGLEVAQSYVEQDFMDHPLVDEREDVQRIYLGNEGPSDADGWATVVDLTGLVLAPLLIGLAATDGLAGRAESAVDGLTRRFQSALSDHLVEADRERLAAAYARISVDHVLLFATIVSLVLIVRAGGILLDRHVEALSVHAIAALCYPVVAVGIPLATATIARGIERRIDAATIAPTALAFAIWLDYLALGVDSLPIDVVVQRLLVVLALGLIAGGSAKRSTRETNWNGLFVGGAILWVAVLVGTLFGYL